MTYVAAHWALLLAAGDGRRLADLTTNARGVTVPKQFCSLERGPSLLQEALERAKTTTESARICAVVAASHKRWWGKQLNSLRPQNIFVQPQNRGTTLGILLPVLQILSRDPEARIVLLPSDHHVQDEDTLVRVIARAVARSAPDIVLLGLRPREPDPGLGYIVSGRARGSCFEIERFIEKPPPRVARELVERGALWNSFIIAARVAALLGLFRRRVPVVVAELSNILASPDAARDRWRRLVQFYEATPESDFSRDIIQGQEAHLSVIDVPECGWSDLGTPQRVAQVLDNPHRRTFQRLAAARWNRCLSLSARHRNLQTAVQMAGRSLS